MDWHRAIPRQALERIRQPQNHPWVRVLGVVLKWAGNAAVCISMLVAPAKGQSQLDKLYPDYPTATGKLPATFLHEEFHPLVLTGEEFTLDPTIGVAAKLFLSGTALWVGDKSGSPFLHVVDAATGVIRRSFGRRGAGPGDFASVVQISSRPGDTSGAWIYDGNLSRLTRMPARVTPGTLPRIINGLGMDRAAGLPRALRMLWLTHERMLLIGFTESNRIMLADSLGHVTRIVPAPILGAPQVTKEVREGSSSGVWVCPKPSGDRFAIAYPAASRVDLFDGNGKSLGRAAVPIPNTDEGDFAQDAAGGWHNPSPRYYYAGCAATQDRLYALFAGRLSITRFNQHARSGPEGTYTWDAQFVHVFDWTGKLLRVLKLDQLAQTIAVAGDTLLYAGGEAMDGIYRYRLPPIPGDQVVPH